jgi:hypothetical protein
MLVIQAEFGAWVPVLLASFAGALDWLFLRRVARRRARKGIIRPPGYRVQRALRWVYSDRTMSLVFNQVFLDWADDWQGAHESGKRSEIIRVWVQGYCIVVKTMFERGWGRVLGLLWSAFIRRDS